MLSIKYTRVQHRLSGPGAAGLLRRLTPSSITSLPTHHSTLSCFLHPSTGGIVDDTVIARLGPEQFYLVTNAACREKDTAYISTHIRDRDNVTSGQVDWEVLDGWGLIALQGPLSAEILQPLLVPPPDTNDPDMTNSDSENVNLKTLYFGQSRFLHLRLANGNISSTPFLVSRGGYTGEDGFEISIPPELTMSATESLLRSAGPNKLRLAGLGARDSLRLEAGMCLYGHDLHDDTTPVEAGLSWIIGKDRRIEGGFFGEEVIRAQLRPAKEGGIGVERRRVGFVIEGAPAREGAEILPSSAGAEIPGERATQPSANNNNDEKKETIGKITSGCPSPSLPSTNIAMGYIKTGHHKAGTSVDVMVRGKRRRATVTKMPFVKTRYWKESSSSTPSAAAA